MAPVLTLFFIIFLEGYVVLSTELLAMRLLVPFTGSGTDTVSIIIAAVLMPLAFGYFAGGRFTRKYGKKKTVTVRKRLIWNLVIAAAILTAGLSYTFLSMSFDFLHQYGGWWNDRIILTTLYAMIFLVYPIFLLGQTVPLISNFFSRQKLAVFAGKILFFSTIGSFLGAVFTTLVLMAFLGVHHAVSITIGCMVLLTFILSKKKISPATVIITLCFALSLLINSDAAMSKFHIVYNNQYSTTQIEDFENHGLRTMKLNGAYASVIYMYSAEPFADYAIFIEDHFIEPIREDGPVKKILILGAGGFAIGLSDVKNEYVYVDIDKKLKEVSEEQFLKKELTPNKEFVAMEARAFLNQTNEKYDMILLDLFRDPTSTPEYLVTREFFQQVKNHVRDGGIVVGNYWGSNKFNDAFSRNLDSTMRAVFPYVNRQTVTPYNGWDREEEVGNVIYTYFHNPEETEPIYIYSDTKSKVMYDKPSRLPKRSR